MTDESKPRKRWPWMLLAVLVLLAAGGAYAYFDLFAPAIEASRTRSEIEAQLPDGSPISDVEAWLAARQFKSFNIPGPQPGKRAGIGAKVPRQALFRYWELWLEFYFDNNEKLTRYEVTDYTDKP
jgi:hypothetical protein